MLIPVFTLYAAQLEYASAPLIGIALGAYGLSQGLLQIPFGMMSDRWGRLPILTAGLLLFAIGSLIGALSHSIYGMILARIIQGSGAIGSVLIALLADLTSEKQRTQAMAIIGGTIGLSFALAMVLSPLMAHYYGLSGIFYLSFALASLGLFIVYTLHLNPKTKSKHPASLINVQTFIATLKSPILRRLDLGIFCQHLILTATFFALPLILRNHIEAHQISSPWQLYLPIMFFAFILTMPLIILADRKGKGKSLFLGAILLTLCCQFGLYLNHQTWLIFLFWLFNYFLAFNVLEASLPSMISKQAPSHNRGTAMGIYSSAQFLGIFFGGTLAGFAYTHGGSQSIFLLNALIGLIWLLNSHQIVWPKRQ